MQDVTVFLLLAMVFNYLMIYQKHKFIGALFFIGLGIATYTIDSSNPFGWLFIILGVSAMVLDRFTGYKRH